MGGDAPLGKMNAAGFGQRADGYDEGRENGDHHEQLIIRNALPPQL
jgi:hypothetical protein